MRKWLTPNLGLASFTCKEKPAHHNMGVADTGQEHNAGGGGQRGGVAGGSMSWVPWMLGTFIGWLERVPASPHGDPLALPEGAPGIWEDPHTRCSDVPLSQ